MNKLLPITGMAAFAILLFNVGCLTDDKESDDPQVLKDEISEMMESLCEVILECDPDSIVADTVEECLDTSYVSILDDHEDCLELIRTAVQCGEEHAVCTDGELDEETCNEEFAAADACVEGENEEEDNEETQDDGEEEADVSSEDVMDAIDRFCALELSCESTWYDSLDECVDDNDVGEAALTACGTEIIALTDCLENSHTCTGGFAEPDTEECEDAEFALYDCEDAYYASLELSADLEGSIMTLCELEMECDDEWYESEEKCISDYRYQADIFLIPCESEHIAYTDCLVDGSFCEDGYLEAEDICEDAAEALWNCENGND